MIYTSNYENAKVGNLISISFDKGDQAKFSGKCCEQLAPSSMLLKHWKNNIDKIEAWKNEQYYIIQYYYHALQHTNFDLLLPMLGDNPILLCYESPNEFCHRFLVSSYLEIKYGIQVPEIKIGVEGQYETTLYKPHYVKDKLLRLVQTHER